MRNDIVPSFTGFQMKSSQLGDGHVSEFETIDVMCYGYERNGIPKKKRKREQVISFKFYADAARPYAYSVALLQGILYMALMG